MTQDEAERFMRVVSSAFAALEAWREPATWKETFGFEQDDLERFLVEDPEVAERVVSRAIGTLEQRQKKAQAGIDILRQLKKDVVGVIP